MSARAGLVVRPAPSAPASDSSSSSSAPSTSVELVVHNPVLKINKLLVFQRPPVLQELQELYHETFRSEESALSDDEEEQEEESADDAEGAERPQRRQDQEPEEAAAPTILYRHQNAEIRITNDADLATFLKLHRLYARSENAPQLQMFAGRRRVPFSRRHTPFRERLEHCRAVLFQALSEAAFPVPPPPRVAAAKSVEELCRTEEAARAVERLSQARDQYAAAPSAPEAQRRSARDARRSEAPDTPEARKIARLRWLIAQHEQLHRELQERARRRGRRHAYSTQVEVEQTLLCGWIWYTLKPLLLQLETLVAASQHRSPLLPQIVFLNHMKEQERLLRGDAAGNESQDLRIRRTYALLSKREGEQRLALCFLEHPFLLHVVGRRVEHEGPLTEEALAPPTTTITRLWLLKQMRNNVLQRVCAQLQFVAAEPHRASSSDASGPGRVLYTHNDADQKDRHEIGTEHTPESDNEADDNEEYDEEDSSFEEQEEGGARGKEAGSMRRR